MTSDYLFAALNKDLANVQHSFLVTGSVCWHTRSILTERPKVRPSHWRCVLWAIEKTLEMFGTAHRDLPTVGAQGIFSKYLGIGDQPQANMFDAIVRLLVIENSQPGVYAHFYHLVRP